MLSDGVRVRTRRVLDGTHRIFESDALQPLSHPPSTRAPIESDYNDVKSMTNHHRSVATFFPRSARAGLTSTADSCPPLELTKAAVRREAKHEDGPFATKEIDGARLPPTPLLGVSGLQDPWINLSAFGGEGWW